MPLGGYLKPVGTLFPYTQAYKRLPETFSCAATALRFQVAFVFVYHFISHIISAHCISFG